MKKLLFILIPLFFIACSEDDKNTSLTDEQIKQKIDEALNPLSPQSEIVEYYINANISFDSVKNTEFFIWCSERVESHSKELEEANKAIENGEQCCPSDSFDSWEEYIENIERSLNNSKERVREITQMYTQNNHIVSISNIFMSELIYTFINSNFELVLDYYQ